MFRLKKNKQQNNASQLLPATSKAPELWNMKAWSLAAKHYTEILRSILSAYNSQMRTTSFGLPKLI